MFIKSRTMTRRRAHISREGSENWNNFILYNVNHRIFLDRSRWWQRFFRLLLQTLCFIKIVFLFQFSRFARLSKIFSMKSPLNFLWRKASAKWTKGGNLLRKCHGKQTIYGTRRSFTMRNVAFNLSFVHRQMFVERAPEQTTQPDSLCVTSYRPAANKQNHFSTTCYELVDWRFFSRDKWSIIGTIHLGGINIK